MKSLEFDACPVFTGLWNLADTAFSIKEFSQVLSRLDWKCEPRADDMFGFRFPVDSRRSLFVIPKDSLVIAAVLPVVYFDENEQESDVVLTNRVDFDEAYNWLRQKMIDVAGEPTQDWVDSDARKYRASLWSTRHGTLIVQQACFDPQFGDEVNVWLSNSKLDALNLKSPLIDSLTSLIPQL